MLLVWGEALPLLGLIQAGLGERVAVLAVPASRLCLQVVAHPGLGVGGELAPEPLVGASHGPRRIGDQVGVQDVVHLVEGIVPPLAGR